MSGRCLWSIGVALSLENASEIYISDGAGGGFEKWFSAANVHK